MCYVTLNPKIGKATEDIGVVKVMIWRKEGLYAYYHPGFRYNKGTPMEEIALKASPAGHRYTISEGYHSFDPERVILTQSETSRDEVGFRIDGNKWKMLFTKDMFLSRKSASVNLGLAWCIIPKGTRYSVNGNGEVVSGTVVVKDILPFSNIRPACPNPKACDWEKAYKEKINEFRAAHGGARLQ